jgi:hypothetical protein
LYALFEIPLLLLLVLLLSLAQQLAPLLYHPS